MMYLCCDAVVNHQQITKIMKKVIAIVFTVLLSLSSNIAYGQKSYPKDMFTYQLDSVVTYKGKAPNIGDFLSFLLAQDETSEILWRLDIAWNHYLRNEPQEPCDQFEIDLKNGYLRWTMNTNLCDVYEDTDEMIYFELCYWNCSDGKHKIVAENVVAMEDGKYYDNQYSGTLFYVYDNATHQMYNADNSILGTDIDASTFEKSKFKTCKPMTKSDETEVTRLPQQGKDVIVELYRGNQVATVCLVWDGMYFKRQ